MRGVVGRGVGRVAAMGEGDWETEEVGCESLGDQGLQVNQYFVLLFPWTEVTSVSEAEREEAGLQGLV